jgi:gluconolactonase
MYAPPEVIETDVFARLPDRFRRAAPSDWAAVNRGGQHLHSFLEGPSFDRAGNLYVVDVNWGRILRVSPEAEWTLVAEYDGQPNGLKIARDGRIFVADYKQGILELDPASGTVRAHVVRHRLEGFKGVNDLYFHYDGTLYFTDQGQTGLHDPTGRVFRHSPEGVLTPLLTNVPSPNGILASADGGLLYVAVTRANAVWRGPFLPDGGLSKVGVFVQLSGGGGPDGMAMDAAGNLAVAHVGMGSVWVFSPTGEPLWRVKGRGSLSITNMAYGDADMRGLYITDSDEGQILKARMPVPGRRLYSHVD